MLHVCVHNSGPPSFVLDTITLETCKDVKYQYMMLNMQNKEGQVQALGCNVGEC